MQVQGTLSSPPHRTSCVASTMSTPGEPPVPRDNRAISSNGFPPHPTLQNSAIFMKSQSDTSRGSCSSPIVIVPLFFKCSTAPDAPQVKEHEGPFPSTPWFSSRLQDRRTTKQNIPERSENPFLVTLLGLPGRFVRCSNNDGFSWHNLPNKNLRVLAIVADLGHITAGNCEVWLRGLCTSTNCHAARVLQRIHTARLAAADGAGCSLAFLARVLLAVSQQSQQHMTCM